MSKRGVNPINCCYVYIMVLKTIINRIKTYAFSAEYAMNIYTILRNKLIPSFQSATQSNYWNIACSAITCFAGICCIFPSEFWMITHSSCRAFSCNIRLSAIKRPSSILSCNSNISSSDMAQFRLSEAVVLPAPLQPPMMYNILSISICKDTQNYSSDKINVAVRRKKQIFSAKYAENSMCVSCTKSSFLGIAGVWECR